MSLDQYPGGILALKKAKRLRSHVIGFFRKRDAILNFELSRMKTQ